VPQYAEPAAGMTLSQFPGWIDASVKAGMALQRGPDAPAVRDVGGLWDDSGAGQIKRWNGTVWEAVYDYSGGVAPAIVASGVVDFEADQDMGGHRLTGLAAGASAGDAVRRDQVLLRDGTQAMTGALNAGGSRVTNMAQATAPTDACRFDQIEIGVTVNAVSSSPTAVTKNAEVVNTHTAGRMFSVWGSASSGDFEVQVRFPGGSWATVGRIKDGAECSCTFVVPAGGGFRVYQSLTVPTVSASYAWANL
jgi:hypothetical protein